MTPAPADMLCFSLYAATHAMQQAYRPLLEELGITYPQYLVLSVLWNAPGAMTVKNIGSDVDLESSTLTPLLKRLEAAGLVIRSRDTNDERQVNVNLTDEGRDLRNRAGHISGCIFNRTGLDLTELEELRNAIASLTSNLRRNDAKGQQE